MFIEEKLQRHLARSGVNKRNVLQFFIREFSSQLTKHESKDHVKVLRSTQLKYISVCRGYLLGDTEFLNAISNLNSFKRIYDEYLKLYKL